MRFSYFVFFENATQPEARISAADQAAITAIVRAVPGLACAHIYTPERAKDFYTNDGPAPQLALQLYFDELTELEAALAPTGHLQALARPDAWPSLAGTAVVQQAMYTRSFPVTERGSATAQGLPCSFLVHYPGHAEDLNAWLLHYVSHHPQIMRRFPGIRQIEVLTRLDWCDAMPWPRVNYMQRNRVMFDSPAALTAAMHSPVRHEMRADFERFPTFHGSNIHYPMATDIVFPERSQR
jgi:hypothetical protein